MTDASGASLLVSVQRRAIRTLTGLPLVRSSNGVTFTLATERIVGHSETAPTIAGRADTLGGPSGVYRSKTFPGLPPSLPFALEAAFLVRLLEWPPI